MKKLVQTVLGFHVLLVSFGLALAQLDDDARELLRKEIEGLSRKGETESEADRRTKKIEELSKQNQARQKDIEELKRELEKAKKGRQASPQPTWLTEVLLQLEALRSTSKSVDTKNYLEDFYRVETKILKLMGDEPHPVRGRVVEILSFYRTVGEVRRWKARPERRRDPKDRTLYSYKSEDPDLRRWLGQHPFFQEAIRTRPRGKPNEGPGKFQADKAIALLLDRAERDTQQVTGSLGR